MPKKDFNVHTRKPDQCHAVQSGDLLLLKEAPRAATERNFTAQKLPIRATYV